MALENNYLIEFDFTTVHGKGRFVGRNGQIDISTDATTEEIYKDLETIQRMCANAVRVNKPKWNIFLITVKSIKLIGGVA
jgi:hypothetical protein